ncbi:hypothetical protein [Variovorax sp. GB1P17]|uniref:hypothetical protein n=1 Tax=Variovorax sp. GB1P17 TaxID=3443740 RepID=UPI003F452A92
MFDPSFIDTSTVDYWYDVGFLDAQKRIVEFDDRQWGELNQHWQAQSDEWQARLAYVLGENTREASLLLAMCCLASDEVQMTARESLRGMPLGLVVDALHGFRGRSCESQQEYASVNAVLRSLKESN